MAKLLLICPGCGKKLETDEGNAGREGQCPHCQKVFPVTSVERGGGVITGGGWLEEATEYEYHEMAALASVGAIGACLLLLIVAACIPWVKPDTAGSDFLPQTRLMFAAVSVACLLHLGVAFAARKSIAPASLTALAWGMLAVLWSGGIFHTFYQALNAAKGLPAEGDIKAAIGTTGGLYLALIAGILTLAAGGFFYFQFRQSDTLRKIGLFLLATQVLALILGVLVVRLHVQPAIQRQLPEVKRMAPPEARMPEVPGTLPTA
jgi:hypothetical protein